ncbi:MAG: aerobic-type carbon monoxide dehydrogenase middle subunit CoxM/CutM-like protein [Elusimicrobia bacterium]|nr:MAG: aerobic-type carbon monoxide dehydrogenase middle subunit CoxM/CutM-like protein [Elusimicrobiota bacterium]KAF0157145.1 MAG: aerobic-type carbon monoxide dehydrogenase middle subunit CoxM/CutM-like protein [Elusimicrobiota bacterium]
MNNLRKCVFPDNLNAALTALGDRKSLPFALAGGTLSGKNIGPETVTLVDLKRLPLAAIKTTAAGLSIGALATFDEIENSRVVKGWAGGVLCAAAAKCSSQLVRNMATIGGNIARPNAFNVFPPLLLALDAKVTVAWKGVAKTFPLAGLYDGTLKKIPGRDCLITGIILPAASKGLKCAFEKFARTESSWESYITLAMCAEVKKGVIKSARIGIGALSAVPVLAPKAAAALTGETPGEAAGKAAALAGDLAGMRISPKSVEFKKEVAAALLRRFVVSLA